MHIFILLWSEPTCLLCGPVRPAPAPHRSHRRSPPPADTTGDPGVAEVRPPWCSSVDMVEWSTNPPKLPPASDLEPKWGRGGKQGCPHFLFALLAFFSFLLHWRFDRARSWSWNYIFCRFHKPVTCFIYRIVNKRKLGGNEWDVLTS